MMEEVLRLRNRGLAVFPVDIATKEPAVKWGGMNAILPSEEQVKDWFSKGDLAVGIATGPISGVILLDFDFKKHPEAREFYEAHHLPRTWQERTGSGGLHFYFKWCDELDKKQTNTTSKLWPGVDSKGFGGYSKIAPSPGYEWIVAPWMAPLAACPQWLIDKLSNKGETQVLLGKERDEDWMIKELEAVKPGSGIDGRTPTFVRAIGRLKGKGLSEVEVKSLLTPWADKYGYTKLNYLVDDQFKRYPPNIIGPSGSDKSEPIDDFLKEITPVRWLCNNMIAEQSITFFAGLPGTMKTWFMIDLAVAAASGTSWMGKFPMDKLKVLYIDQERSRAETQRRFHTILAGREIVPKEIRSHLTVKCQTTIRIDLQNSFDGFKKTLSEERPDLILVDSFKTFHTKDINSNSDMQFVMERIKALRQEFNCTFGFVYHENKGAYDRTDAKGNKKEVTAEHIAGAAVLSEVPETLFVVTKHDVESSFVHHVKNNPGSTSAPFLLKVQDLTPDKTKIAVMAY